jgi:hypothetical protein
MATTIRVDSGTNVVRASVTNQNRNTVRTIQPTTAMSLSQLTDVDLTGVANNEVLVYSSSVGKFVTKTFAEINIDAIDGGIF